MSVVLIKLSKSYTKDSFYKEIINAFPVLFLSLFLVIIHLYCSLICEVYPVYLLRVSNIFCLVNFNIKLKLISLEVRSIVYGDLEARDGCKG